MKKTMCCLVVAGAFGLAVPNEISASPMSLAKPFWRLGDRIQAWKDKRAEKRAEKRRNLPATRVFGEGNIKNYLKELKEISENLSKVKKLLLKFAENLDKANYDAKTFDMAEHSLSCSSALEVAILNLAAYLEMYNRAVSFYVKGMECMKKSKYTNDAKMVEALKYFRMSSACILDEGFFRGNLAFSLANFAKMSEYKRNNSGLIARDLNKLAVEILSSNGKIKGSLRATFENFADVEGEIGELTGRMLGNLELVSAMLAELPNIVRGFWNVYDDKGIQSLETTIIELCKNIGLEDNADQRPVLETESRPLALMDYSNRVEETESDRGNISESLSPADSHASDSSSAEDREADHASDSLSAEGREAAPVSNEESLNDNRSRSMSNLPAIGDGEDADVIKHRRLEERSQSTYIPRRDI